MPQYIIEIHNYDITIRRCRYDDIKELVYALVQLIPIGFVTTYNDIAKVLGISPRLVGKILSKNRKLIEIPCHRVVGTKGIGGYTINTKKALEFKKKLIQIESNGDIKMFNLYKYLIEHYSAANNTKS